jgi:hypothetical protein
VLVVVNLFSLLLLQTLQLHAANSLLMLSQHELWLRLLQWQPQTPCFKKLVTW